LNTVNYESQAFMNQSPKTYAAKAVDVMSDENLLATSKEGPKLNDENKAELYLKYLDFKKKIKT